MDEAVSKAGVLSTVCFRERYRPIFQEARRLLEKERVVHVRFTSPSGLPTSPPDDAADSWHYQMDKAGGRAFDWGVHAVAYTRFMTGLDVVKAQAFYHDPDRYITPLSSSFNLCLSNGATATLARTRKGRMSSCRPVTVTPGSRPSARTSLDGCVPTIVNVASG